MKTTSNVNRLFKSSTALLLYLQWLPWDCCHCVINFHSNVCELHYVNKSSVECALYVNMVSLSTIVPSACGVLEANMHPNITVILMVLSGFGTGERNVGISCVTLLQCTVAIIILVLYIYNYAAHIWGKLNFALCCTGSTVCLACTVHVVIHVDMYTFKSIYLWLCGPGV